MTKTLSTSKKAIAQRARRAAAKAATPEERPEKSQICDNPPAPIGAPTETAQTCAVQDHAALPPAHFANKAGAIAAAKATFGPDAEERVDFVIAKLARKAPDGGLYYWVAMAEVDATWNNRQRHEAGLKPKPRSAPRNDRRSRSAGSGRSGSAAKTAAAKAGQAIGTAKVTSSEKKAAPRTDALIAMASRPEGASVAEMRSATGLKDPATGLRDSCKARGVTVELVRGAPGDKSRYFVRAGT